MVTGAEAQHCNCGRIASCFAAVTYRVGDVNRMLVALRRCAAAGPHIDQRCTAHRQQLLLLAASAQYGRPRRLRSRHCLAATQQHAPDAVLSEPDAPPKPLNIIEEAAAQLGGANKRD